MIIPKIWHVTNFYFSFILGYFLSFYAQKIRIKRNEIIHLEISSFYKCVPKIMITQYMVPDIWCATDVQADRKSDI